MQRKPRSLTFTEAGFSGLHLTVPIYPLQPLSGPTTVPIEELLHPALFFSRQILLFRFPRGPGPPPSCDLEGHTAPFAEEAVEPVPGGADVPREPRVKQSHAPSGASSAGKRACFFSCPFLVA